MIRIDGSEGEGGGQVLRTALTLSLATGTPFQIVNIRAKRQKPGLLRQHLTSVQAATTVGSARVEGAAIGSAALTFSPGAVRAGEYAFSVGTAGSAMLVLQTILPPLLLADAPSTITVEGGTHNPAAPPFEFIDRVFLPVIEELGPRVSRSLERHGFYPAGGGRVVIQIDPVRALSRWERLQRGEITRRHVRVLLANLPAHIARREVAVAVKDLNWPEAAAQIDVLRGVNGPGNALMIEVESEHAREICTNFGESGVPAEAVAGRAVDEVRRYLVAGVPVGRHLADQLMAPLALGQGGSYRTMALTQHALTNAAIVKLFTGATITATTESRDVVHVDIERAQS